MIPRKRLDIGWGDLVAGIRYCLWSGECESVEGQLGSAWAGDASLACLSVRSGFDALLGSLDLDAGSEVLVSALTIRDMTRIVEAHGLVPVPIDLEVATLAVCPESMQRGVSSRTKAIIVAHLFGSRMPMEPIVRFAQAHGLLVIEDCAQAFTGDGYRGHSESDVCMFSFGPIKTATALGGGILVFRDTGLRDRVRACQGQWPLQGRVRYLARVLKYAVLVGLSYRAAYSVFVGLCRVLGESHDRVIGNSVHGFGKDEFFAGIRQRPSAALLALMTRRLRRYDQKRIAARMQIAEHAIALMPTIARSGEQASEHSHWVFPMLHAEPGRLCKYLWGRGFDATEGASSMCVVKAPAGRAELSAVVAQELFARLLYLPVYAGVAEGDVERLARALREYESVGDDQE